MWTPYDKVLDRMQRLRAENPYYRYARVKQKQLVMPWQESREMLERGMSNNDMTDAGIADMMMKNSGQFANMQKQIFDEAENKALTRQETIDNQITETTLKKDVYVHEQEEIEKQKREEKKNAWKNVLLQLGSAGLGAGAGFLFQQNAIANAINAGQDPSKMISPLQSAMFGGRFGASVGKIGAGIDTGTPDFVMKGMETAVDALSGLSSLKEEKQLYGKINEVDFDNVNKNDIALLVGAMESGNRALIDQLLLKLKTQLPKTIKPKPFEFDPWGFTPNLSPM